MHVEGTPEKRVVAYSKQQGQYSPDTRLVTSEAIDLVYFVRKIYIMQSS